MASGRSVMIAYWNHADIISDYGLQNYFILISKRRLRNKLEKICFNLYYKNFEPAVHCDRTHLKYILQNKEAIC
jgi:hypothetical protein